MCLFNMVFQVCLFRETFSTGPAVVRQIIRMGVHVEFEIRHLVESPIALVTPKRFLACVDHNMIPQVAFLVKTFAANVANEGFLVAVRS